MSSVLKILVDIPCQVYCDYEFKGTAMPQSLLKLELRKGKYILEFKDDETTLLSMDYEITANDEEFLLKIDLVKEKENDLHIKQQMESETVNDFNTVEPLCKGFNLVKKAGKCGVYSDLGNCIIPTLYDEIQKYEVYSGLYGGAVYSYYLVMLDGKQGLYDDKGKEVIPIKYDNLSGKYLIKTKLDNKIGLYTKDGKIIPIPNEIIGDIKIQDFNRIIMILIHDLWYMYHYLDDTAIVTPISWQDHSHTIAFKSFTDGHQHQFIVEIDNETTQFRYASNLHNGNYAVFDCDTCNITIANCDSIEKANSNCYIFKKSGKVGLINKEGTLLYDCVYDAIDVMDDYIIAQQDGYYIVYDYDGNVVLENYIVTNTSYRNPIHCGGYDFVQPTVVIKDGKYGCLNQDITKKIEFQSYGDVCKLKEIIPCEYDFVAYEDKALDVEENYGEEHWPWIGCYFVKKESNGNLHYYKYDCTKDSATLVEDFVLPNPQKNYLFFDTETTGIPKNYNVPSSDTNNWPRLVQLAWILTDQHGTRISSGNYIVKPEGFVIPLAASIVHGITTQKAKQEGVSLKTVVNAFLKDFDQASYLVGHNISFDKKIIGAELIRLGMKDIMDTKTSYCTMQSSTDFCKIPSYNGLGYKYPKLQELHKKLFGREFVDAHNAMSDIEATEKCFWELRKRGCL